MPKVSKKKAVQPKLTDRQAPTILALVRPDRPAVVDKPVKDEVILPPTTEEPVSDDAASSLPLPEKPSIEVANNTEPERAPDEEKPKKIIELPRLDSISTVTNSLGITLKLGDSIQVTAPWGGKEAVEIASIYESPSGEKWLQFKPCQDIKTGWTWEGGVIRAELASLITL
ncbi:MAG TPA: hypothetical protein V6D26_09660 [Stenomitos sp.]